MAEIRKHNPTTSDIGEQVRALYGDNITPLRPGWTPDDEPIDEPGDEPTDENFDPFAGDVDDEDEPSNIIPFRVGGAPLIGLLPSGFDPWDDDEDPDSAA